MPFVSTQEGEQGAHQAGYPSTGPLQVRPAASRRMCIHTGVIVYTHNNIICTIRVESEIELMIEKL